MTNLELASAMRNKLFADMGVDVDKAFDELHRAVYMLPQGQRLPVLVSMYSLTNTICNLIEANEGEKK